jgi:hypothetical protein
VPVLLDIQLFNNELLGSTTNSSCFNVLHTVEDKVSFHICYQVVCMLSLKLISLFCNNWLHISGVSRAWRFATINSQHDVTGCWWGGSEQIVMFCMQPMWLVNTCVLVEPNCEHSSVPSGCQNTLLVFSICFSVQNASQAFWTEHWQNARLVFRYNRTQVFRAEREAFYSTAEHIGRVLNLFHESVLFHVLN